MIRVPPSTTCGLAAWVLFVAVGAPPAGAAGRRRPAPSPQAPEAIVRPWLHTTEVLGEARLALENASDSTSLAAAVERSLGLGDYEEVVGRLAAAGSEDAASLLERVGLRPAGRGLAPTGPPPEQRTAAAILPPVDPRARETFLRDRFATFRLVNKSTYFDIHSDRPAGEVQHYTDLLNDYYRRLRNRFRTSATSPSTSSATVRTTCCSTPCSSARAARTSSASTSPPPAVSTSTTTPTTSGRSPTPPSTSAPTCCSTSSSRGSRLRAGSTRDWPPSSRGRARSGAVGAR